MRPMGGMNQMSGGLNPMSGAMNPMSGAMNPMSGGMNPMGMNPMNQMSKLFPGLTGGISPMTGSVQKQGQQTACSPAPTTCPVPQPWCERIADSNGCIKCLCGNGKYILLSLIVRSPSANIVAIAAKNYFSTLRHAEFLKWNNPSCTFGTVHYHVYRDIKMKT